MRENGAIHPHDEGTPQGGSISVLLRPGYLHDVLDRWVERVVKPRLPGEASVVRDLDDVVVCLQFRADALRVQAARHKRVGKFGRP
jgi:RNA-directed DNA polymerase